MKASEALGVVVKVLDVLEQRQDELENGLKRLESNHRNDSSVLHTAVTELHEKLTNTSSLQGAWEFRGTQKGLSDDLDTMIEEYQAEARNASTFGDAMGVLERAARHAHRLGVDFGEA